MPNSIRPGDVLADRYTLVDLLSESGSGRFWRAHDRVLERHVALHVVPSSDERAEDMMEAARQSATVLDRRILRVLDADRRDNYCYVVNEWGSGISLDILVGRDGAVGPRRAAWIVSEVAASVAVGHDAGVAHGRLIPENVLIDRAGAVRLISFSVDAALLGLPPGRVSTDVTDLGGLLYFLLTGKWAGVSRSGVPSAPQVGGRVLRPRQVRAGIPRVLDSLCDQVLNGYPADRSTPDAPDLTTASGIADALREFVGDAADMAAAEAASQQAAHQSDQQATQRTIALPKPPGLGPAGAGDQPTQAGVPIFDDEQDDVSWLAARAEQPPPPPPFEEPPERPLFAPEPPDGTPARLPRTDSASRPAAEYWPWDTGTGSGTVLPPVPEEDDEVPGRSWLRLAAAIAASLLLLVAIVFAFNLGRGRSPLGAEPADDNSPTTTEPAATSEPIAGVTASDFDPQGDPPEENPELAPLVVDGDPTTAWHTLTYEQNLGPAGLKTGVGLALDLGESREVSAVDLTFVGEPATASIYLAPTEPDGLDGLEPVAEANGKIRQRVTLDEPATGRFLVVWLTSLPLVDDGYRGEVAEVVVRG